jgi:hypothetical protein
MMARSEKMYVYVMFLGPCWSRGRCMDAAPSIVVKREKKGKERGAVETNMSCALLFYLDLGGNWMVPRYDWEVVSSELAAFLLPFL